MNSPLVTALCSREWWWSWICWMPTSKIILLLLLMSLRKKFKKRQCSRNMTVSDIMARIKELIVPPEGFSKDAQDRCKKKIDSEWTLTGGGSLFTQQEWRVEPWRCSVAKHRIGWQSSLTLFQFQKLPRHQLLCCDGSWPWNEVREGVTVFYAWPLSNIRAPLATPVGWKGILLQRESTQHQFLLAPIPGILWKASKVQAHTVTPIRTCVLSHQGV